MTPGGVEVTGKTAESLPAGHWSNYPITAVRRISSNFGASGLKGVDVSISCDIPPVSVAMQAQTQRVMPRGGAQAPTAIALRLAPTTPRQGTQSRARGSLAHVRLSAPGRKMRARHRRRRGWCVGF